MKLDAKTFRRLAPCAALLSTLAFGCDPGDDGDQPTDPASLAEVPEDADAEFLAAQAAWEAGEIEEGQLNSLATFELSNGSTVEFVVAPETGEVGVRESGTIGTGAVVTDDESLTPLQAYVMLAAAEAPIPRAIADNAAEDPKTPALLEGRELVDAVPAPQPVQVEDLGVSIEPPVAQDHGCSNTGLGALIFDGDHCEYEDNRNKYCDPGSFTHGGGWTLLYRANHDKKRKSYSRTAACWSTGAVHHYYWNGNKWIQNFWNLIPENGWEYWRWNGGAKLYRRIKHYPWGDTNGDGYIRAWSEFHN